MSTSKDRYPNRYATMKPRKRLTPGQRKTMAAAFVDRLMEETQAKKQRQEHP